MKLEQARDINKIIMDRTNAMCESYGKELPPVEEVVRVTDIAMNYIEGKYPGLIGDYGQMYLLVGNTVANYMMMYRRDKVWGK